MTTAATAEALAATLVSTYLPTGTKSAIITEAEFTAVRRASGVDEEEAADEGFTVQLGQQYYHFCQVEVGRRGVQGSERRRYELSIC